MYLYLYLYCLLYFVPEILRSGTRRYKLGINFPQIRRLSYGSSFLPIETKNCYRSRKNCPKIFHRQMSAHFDSNIMFRRENHIKNSVFYFDPKIYNFARKLTKKIVLLYFKCEILLKNPLFVLLCFQKSKNGKYMYFVLDQKQHIAQRHVFCT